MHVTAVERSGINSLDEGVRISFETEPDKRGKGPKAVNLQASSRALDSPSIAARRHRAAAMPRTFCDLGASAWATAAASGMSGRRVMPMSGSLKMIKMTCAAAVAVAVMCAGFAGSAKPRAQENRLGHRRVDRRGQVPGEGSHPAVVRLGRLGGVRRLPAATPGYHVTSHGYKCKPGGLGYNCVGTSTTARRAEPGWIRTAADGDGRIADILSRSLTIRW